ncbi:MAG: TIM barrel protein [Planctomycetota bacterium]|jgi:hydroxypyruvate isomerase
MNRRSFIASGAVAGAATFLHTPAAFAEATNKKMEGRIRQSVSRWCYDKIPFDEFAQYCSTIGIGSVELVSPNDWAVLKKHDLICAMTPSHSIGKGLNRVENHDECLTDIRKSIEDTAEAGFPNVICFSGNRAGMDDDEGLKNCEIAIKKILGFAEKKNVTLCMKDYMCDRTAWGSKLVRKVGSDRFKLLYDIYHMQVQEGDIIATITEYADCIGHYHTAGVPGRHEIDDSQELYYPAIMKAILETGYKGYVGHEFVPKNDPLTSLAQAVHICNV